MTPLTGVHDGIALQDDMPLYPRVVALLERMVGVSVLHVQCTNGKIPTGVLVMTGLMLLVRYSRAAFLDRNAKWWIS
jgi:hypothetical protein